ncbi:5093_t:CDS:2, partial [Ambispora leptoticha]
PLCPIPVTAPFYQVGVDFVDPLPRTPRQKLYGREAHQPIHPIRADSLLKGTILQRTYKLIDHLPCFRDKAMQNIQQTQAQQKAYHDTHYKLTPGFDIGEKVLLYKATKELSKSGKFEPKWYGLFYIHDRLPNNAYKLRTINGKSLLYPFLNFVKISVNLVEV